MQWMESPTNPSSTKHNVCPTRGYEKKKEGKKYKKWLVNYEEKNILFKYVMGILVVTFYNVQKLIK